MLPSGGDMIDPWTVPSSGGEHLPFKHAHMQTLFYKPHERLVRYPLLAHLHHGPAMNRVEKGLDVCLENHIRSALPAPRKFVVDSIFPPVMSG
jgi:hypothetical protein